MIGSRRGRFGPDWPHRERSQYVRVEDAELHIQRFGSAGRSILLLHGTGASTHSMRNLAPALARECRVLVPDLPGHGESQAARDASTIGGMASAMQQLCDTVECAPDVIVGHSAGAVVGLEMALRSKKPSPLVVGVNAAVEPMQGYALFSPLAKLLFANAFVPSAFAWLARREGTAQQLLDQTGTKLDAAAVAFYRRLFTDADHVAGALRMMANWDLVAFNRRLGTLRGVLILINAMDDGTVPARDASAQAKRVRDGRTISLRDGGHLVHEVRPEKIADMILTLPELHALRDAA